MTLIREIDYGTPASRAEEAVTLTIDGEAVTVPAGTSIMRAAMAMGTEIPKLCATDMLESFGSCRVCLVEIDGRAGTPASCTTLVADGMVVHTQTERLARIRRGVMELYASDHPVPSLADPVAALSELPAVAAAVGLTEIRYAPGANHVAAECLDAENPLHMAMDG
jgi:formate dehydrogenase major subunit